MRRIEDQRRPPDDSAFYRVTQNAALHRNPFVKTNVFGFTWYQNALERLCNVVRTNGATNRIVGCVRPQAATQSVAPLQAAGQAVSVDGNDTVS
jgi:hypothetical protein